MKKILTLLTACLCASGLVSSGCKNGTAHRHTNEYDVKSYVLENDKVKEGKVCDKCGEVYDVETEEDALICRDAAALESAVQTATEDITAYLTAGTYTIPQSVSGKEVHLIGLEQNVIVDCTKAQALHGADLEFENLTIQGVNEDYVGLQHAQKVEYKHCTIDSRITLYANEVEFEDCTFYGKGDYIWTYGANAVKFERCVFDNVDSRAILVYQEQDDVVCNVTVKDCVFKAQAKGYTSGGDHTAAIEVDSSLAPASVTVVNSTADGNYNGIVRHKNGSNATITVDGVPQASPQN